MWGYEFLTRQSVLEFFNKKNVTSLIEIQVTIREITCAKIKLIWSRIYTWSIIFNNSMTYFALDLEKKINHTSLTILAQNFQYYD